MRTDELKAQVEQFQKPFSDVKLETVPVSRGQLFKLSWPTGGQQRGYIDVFHDPQEQTGVIVQHGTYNPATKAGRPCGMASLPLPQVAKHLQSLKEKIDSEAVVAAPAPQWKYTPRVDINTVRALKF